MKRLIPAASALACAWGAFAAAAVAVPPGHPPDAGSAAPPAAWVDMPGTDRWLGYSTYCWTTQCADYINPEMRTDLPKITVTRGQVVRFRLGFAPKTLSLQVGDRSYDLHPRQNAAWRVRGKGGVLVLFATAERGDASYVARLRVRAATPR
ncbi:MAG: hypothetical protein QOD86_371 [Miltoncostaeaceae bacterium]|jgi:hypothetical protein|nr:hypothetical protein [Miltoncostaeaceae bacterium]